MEVIIKGAPEEIAALVRSTQERQTVKIELEPPVKTMTQAFMEQYRKELRELPAGMPDLLADAKALGLTDGSRPRDLVTREECAVMTRAAALK